MLDKGKLLASRKKYSNIYIVWYIKGPFVNYVSTLGYLVGQLNANLC